MGVDVARQALSLALALGLGALTGLCYDLLRPLRRRGGRAAGALMDALFCIAAGAALFAYAMSAANGRLGIWELAAALAGFLIYMHTLSGVFLPVFTAAADVFYKIMATCKKTMKKSAVSAKIIFQKVRECFIIKK